MGNEAPRVFVGVVCLLGMHNSTAGAGEVSNFGSTNYYEN
jgi:hypothetical protein